MEQSLDILPEAKEVATPLLSNQATTPLLPLIAQGNVDAVDRFVEKYGGLIWTIAKKMTRSTHDAEDLVQKIFIELWKKAAKFNAERGNEVAFISIVAKRRVFDRLRKQNLAKPLVNLCDSDDWESYQDSTSSLEIEDEVAKVRKCLSQLTSKTQDVLKLILQEGMTQQEVATFLHIPLGSVKSFARRGLITLRDCVKRPINSFVLEANHETI